MKIFMGGDNWSSKVNFVDENNVVLGYDFVQCCCEDFGWFVSDKVEDGIIENQEIENIEEYYFDTSFFETADIMNCDYSNENLTVFKITDGKNEKYIHLYNFHNGYYSHGFDLDVGGETIYCGNI